MTAVYVNGFDFGTSEDTIEKHFSTAGRVDDVRLISNGAAIVTYANAADASRAIDELNETTMEGNRRYVSVKLDGKGEGKGKGGGKYDREKGDYDKGKGSKSRGKGSRDNAEPFDGELHDGTVSAFFDDRGFGFITPSDGGDDVYVHFSAIKSGGYRTLREGQNVRFGIGQDPKGEKGDSSGKGKGKGKSKSGGKAVHVELA